MRKHAGQLIAFLTYLSMAAPVSADTLVDCRNAHEPEIKVRVCTKVLNLKGLEPRALAGAHYHRATAYARLRHERDAIADSSVPSRGVIS